MHSRALHVRGLLVTAALLLSLAPARAAHYALISQPGAYGVRPAEKSPSSDWDEATLPAAYLPAAVDTAESPLLIGALADTMTATVSIQPVTSIVVLSRTFTVSVVISDVVNLGAFQFDLYYDPAVIHGEGATLGPFLGSSGRAAIPTETRVDDETGLLSFGAYSLSSPPQPGPDGSGVLAEVGLTAQATGASSLSLEEVQVLDPPATQMSARVDDGNVVVIATSYLPLVWGR